MCRTRRGCKPGCSCRCVGSGSGLRELFVGISSSGLKRRCVFVIVVLVLEDTSREVLIHLLETNWQCTGPTIGMTPGVGASGTQYPGEGVPKKEAKCGERRPPPAPGQNRAHNWLGHLRRCKDQNCPPTHAPQPPYVSPDSICSSHSS